MNRLICSLSSLLFITATAQAEPKTLALTINGGKEDQTNVLVTVPLPGDSTGGAEVLTADNKSLPAQITAASLLSAATDKSPELHILIPTLKAGQTLNLTAKLGVPAQSKESFTWTVADGLPQLDFNGGPVVRYFYKPFDAKLSKPKQEIANPTIKPYHHLFAPDGKTLVTNSNQGQYPHHRGIFYGFNNISYEGKKADIWHCRNGEHTVHEKILSTEAGPLLGRHTLQISWHGQDSQIFANERRELTVYHVPGGTLIDFASELTTPLAKVRLDGDPQHAGFHFRANAAMEKNPKETVFLRPDGKGNPGEEKNWEPKGKSGPVNLPWDAMSFVLDGQRYTVVYLDHPQNPKEARQSERCYGRIGTYFEYDLTKDKPLKVQYRLWFQPGEPTLEQCSALSKAFVNQPPSKTASR